MRFSTFVPVITSDVASRFFRDRVLYPVLCVAPDLFLEHAKEKK
jgi:hypothetical protein